VCRAWLIPVLKFKDIKNIKYSKNISFKSGLPVITMKMGSLFSSWPPWNRSVAPCEATLKNVQLAFINHPFHPFGSSY
jgi:hypothetical protein